MFLRDKENVKTKSLILGVDLIQPYLGCSDEDTVNRILDSRWKNENILTLT